MIDRGWAASHKEAGIEYKVVSPMRHMVEVRIKATKLEEIAARPLKG